MSDAHRNQLMGSGSGQMNLQAVRTRAEELRRSIQECINALASGSVPITYQDVLKKYSVVNEQLAMLRDQVQRGVLKHLVVHPVMVDGPGVAMALPIQLSSRLTPEMEEERTRILATTTSSLLLPTHLSQQYQQQHQQHQQQQQHLAQPEEVAACLSRVQSKIDHHNTLISSLAANDGPLDPKGSKRQEIDKLTRSIADLVSKAKEEDATANFLLGSEALISKGGERLLGGSMAVHGNVAHTSAPRVGREGRGHSSLVQLKKEQEAKRVRLNPPSAAQGAGAGAGGGGVKGGAQALEKPPLDATLVALLTGRGIKPPPNRPTLQR